MADRSHPVDRRQALRITAVAGASIALGGGLVSELFRRAALHRVSESRTRLGTVVTITVVHPDAGAARHMVSTAFSELERLEALLSRHREGTAVHELNTTGELAPAPRELIDVLDKSTKVSEISNGAFDVTVAPLLDLYSSWFRREAGPPTSERVQDALELVDYRGVRVEDHRVTLADPRMSVTLDGIAKGYIVDRTVSVLESAGAERVLVNAGGDMATAGVGSVDDPWLVSVQDPADELGYVELVRLMGDSIATSGDYMRTFTEDRRFHHIVDPRTGLSPDHASSASVVARTAMEADALSTAALVLGPVQGPALLDRLSDVEGVIVTKNGEKISTKGMSRHVAPA